MFRNHLHPISLFSCLVLSLGVLFLAISAEVFLDHITAPSFDYLGDTVDYDFWNWSTEDIVIFFICLGIGAFLCTSALGLIFHKKWARHILQAVFITLALLWLGLLAFTNPPLREDPILFAGITVTILGCVVGALLFLNNADWVLPHFQKVIQGEIKQEILDQDVWDPKL